MGVYRYARYVKDGGLRLLSILSLKSTRHLLLNLCESWMNIQYHDSLFHKNVALVIMSVSVYFSM